METSAHGLSVYLQRASAVRSLYPPISIGSMHNDAHVEDRAVGIMEHCMEACLHWLNISLCRHIHKRTIAAPDINHYATPVCQPHAPLSPQTMRYLNSSTWSRNSEWTLHPFPTENYDVRLLVRKYLCLNLCTFIIFEVILWSSSTDQLTSRSVAQRSTWPHNIKLH